MKNRDPLFALMPTEDLLPNLECLRWDRLICAHGDEPSSTRESGLAFIDLQIADLEREVALRERWRSQTGAPSWPPQTSEERQQLLREIKERVSVLDLYHRHFPMQPLRKAGKSWRGRCVFHGGNNPNALSVFNDGRNWHCHNCGAGGDVVEMAKLLYRSTSFREVVDRLAEEFGIEHTEKMIPPDSFPRGFASGGVISGRNKPAKTKFPEFIGGEVVVR